MKPQSFRTLRPRNRCYARVGRLGPGGCAGRGRAGGAGATTMTATLASPAARLASALEQLGECYGVRPPEPEDEAGVVIFLAEGVRLNRHPACPDARVRAKLRDYFRRKIAC